jgi:hypothetical protein
MISNDRKINGNKINTRYIERIIHLLLIVSNLIDIVNLKKPYINLSNMNRFFSFVLRLCSYLYPEWIMFILDFKDYIHSSR